MRVLVTGGGGYIGSVATEQLLESGHDVVVLDDLCRGHRGAVHPDAELHEVDVRDAAGVHRVVQESNAEAVMHFAALHLVPESVQKPAEYYATNIGGGQHLLDAVRATGIEKFIFSSTAAVYGEPERVPIREDDPKHPINPYGRSKWMVEQFLDDYSAQYGLKYAAFRYFNVAGATQRYGEDHDPETHVIPVALQVIQGKRDAFTIFGTDYPTEDGTCIRDYLHVLDLVDAHIAALGKLDESLGAFNLGTRDGFSVQQIVDAVQRVTGKELPVTYGPRRAGDPSTLIADASRTREVLGWVPQHSTMDEMIGSAWSWMQRNPHGYET